MTMRKPTSAGYSFAPRDYCREWQTRAIWGAAAEQRGEYEWRFGLYNRKIKRDWAKTPASRERAFFVRSGAGWGEVLASGAA
jgi:hypothetical protein